MAAANEIRSLVQHNRQTSSKGHFGITISAGVASVLATDGTIEDVIERADMQLYRAKNLGRNRVCVERTSNEITATVPAVSAA